MAIRRLAKVAAAETERTANLQYLQSCCIIQYTCPTCYNIYILHAASRDDRVVSIFLETARQKHNVTQNVYYSVCVCVLTRVLAFTRVQWIEQTLLTDKKLETT